MPAAPNPAPISTNIHAQHISRMPLQSSTQRPIIRAKHIHAFIEAAAHEKCAAFLRLCNLPRGGVRGGQGEGGVVGFEPAQVADDAFVRAHAAGSAHHAHVPALDPAVAGARQHAVRVGRPINGVDLADVAVEDHDRASRAQVPDAADAVEARGREQGAVGVKGEGVDFAGVAFLKQKLGGSGDVPEAPGGVVGGGGEVGT